MLDRDLAELYSVTPSSNASGQEAPHVTSPERPPERRSVGLAVEGSGVIHFERSREINYVKHCTNSSIDFALGKIPASFLITPSTNASGQEAPLVSKTLTGCLFGRK